jgi:hypothetical protein
VLFFLCILPFYLLEQKKWFSKLFDWWIKKSSSQIEEKMRQRAEELLKQKVEEREKLPSEKEKSLKAWRKGIAELQEKFPTIEAEYSQKETKLADEITELETFLGNP